jgi:hypothetical protein
LDLKKLRHKPAIMKEEEEISRRIFFLSCKDGGLGVTCIERTVDSAFVGTWIAIMKHVVKDQLNLDDPKSLEQQLQTIKDVKNATNRLLIDLASNKFEGPEQEDSVGMSDNDENKNYKSPKLTIRELLRKIADHAGLASNDEIDILWNRGIQSTLGHALSVVNANSLAEYLAKFGCPAGKNIKLQDNQFYISFMSRRNDFSNRFLNRAHLSDKARRFTNKDLKSTIASILMLQRYPLEYKCAHCGMDDVRFIGHIQSCEKSHATTKTNNGKAEIKYGSRNHTLHKIAKFFLQWFFNLIPGVTSDFKHEPLLREHYSPIKSRSARVVRRNNTENQSQNTTPASQLLPRDNAVNQLHDETPASQEVQAITENQLQNTTLAPQEPQVGPMDPISQLTVQTNSPISNANNSGTQPSPTQGQTFHTDLIKDLNAMENTLSVTTHPQTIRDDIRPTPVSTQTSQSSHKYKNGQRGDFTLVTVFPGENDKLYIGDFTCHSNFVKSNRNKNFHKVGDKVLWKYNGVAEKAHLAKETLYGSLWDHGGGIIPFAYDSAGNPSKDTRKFINHIFARGDKDNGTKREWDNEATRVQYKKRFLDTLSCIIASAIARDIKAMERTFGIQHIMKNNDDVFDQANLELTDGESTDDENTDSGEETPIVNTVNTPSATASTRESAANIMIRNINTNDSGTVPPLSRGPNSVDILRQSQTLGTGANTNTLLNDDDVMNPSSNNEAEEGDNSSRIVLGDYTREEMEKMVSDWFIINPEYAHSQMSTLES